MRRHVLLADAGYGDCRQFREEVRQRGLHYLVAVNRAHTVWPPDAEPQPPFREKKPGRPRTRYFDANRVRPVTLAKLAASLPPRAFRTVRWRDGSRGVQSSRFAAVRVRTAENHQWKAAPSEEVWLLVEWPRSEEAPTTYHLCSMPADTPLKELVRLSKLRWRVERDYQELKGEVGLDHFEGRTWRGFHHHATLCMVAHGFLALQRARIPPGEGAVDPARSVPPHAGAARRADWSLPAM